MRPFWTTFTAYRRMALALMLTLLIPVTTHAAAELQASIDRDKITEEETFRLTVRSNESNIFSEPDFSQLTQDFDILAQQKSNQYRSYNGRAESWTQWTLTLAPKHSGTLLVPSFELNGSFSEALEVTVGDSAQTTQPLSSDNPIFLEAELSRPKAYVQQQVLLTLRLYTRVGLTSVNRGDISIDKALVKQVDEAQYQRTIKGENYVIVETSYALFPQQSGTLEIPAVLWTVTTQGQGNNFYDPFFNRGGQQLRLRTGRKYLEVAPKPDPYTGSTWLPANKVTLQEQWSSEPESFRVGEPITRRVIINAEGLMASQLPPLDIPEVTGLKYYPDQPAAEESENKNGVTARKTESYAIVPSQPGRYTLPAITLSWWDNAAEREQQATLPARDIQVAPAAATTAPAHPMAAVPQPEAAGPTIEFNSPAQVITADSLWFYTTLLFAGISVVLMALWLRARGRPAPHQISQPAPASGTQANASESAAFKALQIALRGQDLSEIRTALQHWSQQVWCEQASASAGEKSPTGAIALQKLRLNSEPLNTAVEQLDRALFSAVADGVFDSTRLLQAVTELRNTGKKHTNEKEPLAPLYPQR